MFRKVLSFLLVLVFFLLSAKYKDVYAQLESESTYSLDIQVQEDETVDIVYNIKIKNNSTKFFIRDYSIISDHTDLLDIRVSENGKLSNFSKVRLHDKVKLTLPLRENLVTGDTTDITIRYTTTQLLIKQGRVLKLFIPPIKTEETLKQGNISVDIPKILGNISYLSNYDFKSREKDNSLIMDYDHKDAPEGMLIMIGDQQQFEFRYVYNFENSSDSEKIYTVTLPVDSVFQDIYYANNSTVPTNVMSDLDGNTLAEFVLKPKEKEELSISGYSRFYLKRKPHIVEKDHLLGANEIWDYKDRSIKKEVSSIVKTSNSDYDNAKLLYDSLLKRFEFIEEYKTAEISASMLLNTKEKLSCNDFSNIYVSYLRAARIPARKVIGMAYKKTDLDTKHHWVEFYSFDKERWVGTDLCIDAELDYSSFDNIDPSRFILAYRGYSYNLPKVIEPFKDYQESGFDNVEINFSTYDFDQNDSSVQFSYKLGEVEFMADATIIDFFVTNPTDQIFRIYEAKVDDKRLQFIGEEELKNYHEAVFPDQSKYFRVLFDELLPFTHHEGDNYRLKVNGGKGNKEFSYEDEFQLHTNLSFIRMLVWIGSGVWGVLFLLSIWIIFSGVRGFIKRGKREIDIGMILNHLI